MDNIQVGMGLLLVQYTIFFFMACVSGLPAVVIVMSVSTAVASLFLVGIGVASMIKKKRAHGDKTNVKKGE